MASIVKRKNSYSVIYYNSNKRQVWETYPNLSIAKARKAQIELYGFQKKPWPSKPHFLADIENGLLSSTPENDALPTTPIHKVNRPQHIYQPLAMTVSELMNKHIELYGTIKWSPSTFSGNTGLIKNYITPLFGDIAISRVNRILVAEMISTLQQTKPVERRGRRPATEYLSQQTIGKIFKLLHCAFRNAVRWEICSSNPFDDAQLPRSQYKPRASWNEDSVKQAITQCNNPALFLCINLAFGCSLRLGEILGLTWDCVHINDEDLRKQDAHLYVNKELARLTLESIKSVHHNDILYTFPPMMAFSKSRLVLKSPKTLSSNRKVWIPPTLAHYLNNWRHNQIQAKQALQHTHPDYNLVISQANGRPVEGRIIEAAFSRLKEDTHLPNVVSIP